MVVRAGVAADATLAAELQEHVRTRLAAHEVPRRIEFRADLPDAQDEQALRGRLARLSDVVRDLMQHPAFLADVLNLQRGLVAPEPYYDLPAQAPSRVFQVMRKAQVAVRPGGYCAVFDGGEVELGATYPAVE